MNDLFLLLNHHRIMKKITEVTRTVSSLTLLGYWKIPIAAFIKPAMLLFLFLNWLNVDAKTWVIYTKDGTQHGCVWNKNFNCSTATVSSGATITSWGNFSIAPQSPGQNGNNDTIPISTQGNFSISLVILANPDTASIVLTDLNTSIIIYSLPIAAGNTGDFGVDVNLSNCSMNFQNVANGNLPVVIGSIQPPVYFLSIPLPFCVLNVPTLSEWGLIIFGTISIIIGISFLHYKNHNHQLSSS
jgi:hypothetical protein